MPLPAEGSIIQFWEPLSTWFELSQKAQALLRIAAQVNLGKRAGFEDWNIVKGTCDSGLGETQAEGWVKDLRKARREIAWELDGWVSMGQVRPRLSWSKAKVGWRFVLDAVSTGPNLFGLLALYLANEVAGTGKGVAFCSSCGQSYRPERRLNANTRNYCPLTEPAETLGRLRSFPVSRRHQGWCGSGLPPVYCRSSRSLEHQSIPLLAHHLEPPVCLGSTSPAHQFAPRLSPHRSI